MSARALPIPLAFIALLVAGADPAGAHDYVPPPGADVQLVCDWGSCPEVVHHGQRYVVAELGRRYVVAVSNPSDRWVEAVITVDGRNVLDGHRPSARSRGYLIPPNDQIRIEGWRVSRSEVAAFRFTSVGDSYAGRLGDSRDAGTVRVQIFPELRRRAWIPRPEPVPYDPQERDDGSPRDKAAPDGARVETERRGDGWHRQEQNLGTEFGESRWQPIEERDFVREDPSRPARTITLRYDDRDGLMARGVLAPPPWRWDEHWVEPPPDR